MSESSSDQIVWVASGRRARDIYHTDPECGQLRQIVSVRKMEKSKILESWRECSYCSGDLDKQTGEVETTTCERCGEEYKETATHVRNCSGWN